MWCARCLRNGWTMDKRYPTLCLRCGDTHHRGEVAKARAAAPNHGRSDGYKDTDERKFVYYATLADAQADYLAIGADVGPRRSNVRRGKYYLTYRK